MESASTLSQGTGVTWQANLVVEEARILEVARRSRRVAVLGIKTEAQAGVAAFYVAEYLVAAGVDVVPVPVYFPGVREILGRPVFRQLVYVPPPPIDLVDVFRRSRDVAAHVDDILAARPRAVWLQLGIRNDEAAERIARAGILVVQDRCLMIDHRRALRMPG